MPMPIPKDVKALAQTIARCPCPAPSPTLARYARSSAVADPAADEKHVDEMMYDLAARWGVGLEEAAARFPTAEASLHRYCQSGAKRPLAMDAVLETLCYADRHGLDDFGEAHRRYVAAKRAHERQPVRY